MSSEQDVTLVILKVALLTPIVAPAQVLDTLVLIRVVMQEALGLLPVMLLVPLVVLTMVLLDVAGCPGATTRGAHSAALPCGTPRRTTCIRRQNAEAHVLVVREGRGVL